MPRTSRSPIPPAGCHGRRLPRPPSRGPGSRGSPPRSAALRLSCTGPPLHGTTGIPSRSASCLARTLSPSSLMTSLGGPTNVIPAASQRAAKSADSATKPQPTQTESARARPSAAITVSTSTYALCRLPSGSAIRAGPSGTASIGLPYEQRRRVGVGVQRDRGYRLAEVLAELADGGQAPHGRLAPVDDGKPLDARHSASFTGRSPVRFALHRGSAAGRSAGSWFSESVGPVAVDAQYHVAAAVKHLAVEAAVGGGMSDSEQLCLGNGLVRHADKVRVGGQRHVPGVADLPQARGLEARLRQPRLGGRVPGLWRVPCWHVPGETGDSVGTTVPGLADHLVSRSVEEHVVDVAGGDRRCLVGSWRLGSLLLRSVVHRGRGQSDLAGEVRRDARRLLADEHPAGAQRAVRDEIGPIGPDHRGHGDRARLVPVELQRGDEVHLLDVGHPHIGNGEAGQGRERLDAHHPGQHRRAVDPVVAAGTAAPRDRAWSAR